MPVSARRQNGAIGTPETPVPFRKPDGTVRGASEGEDAVPLSFAYLILSVTVEMSSSVLPSCETIRSQSGHSLVSS